MKNQFLPFMCRKCEMETSWQLFREKTGAGTHTIEYNERTISYVFAILCLLLLLHLSIMFSHTIPFHSEAAKYVRITDNGFLAT